MGDSALLRSLQRLAPIVEVVEEEVELDDVDARAELAAIERLSDDIREFLARPVAVGETVDVTELVDAIVASRVDEASLARAIAGAVLAAVPAPVAPNNSAVLDAFATVTKELASLRKKMSGVAASGGGGGYGEVALRTANKEPVGEDNPLPVSFVSTALGVVAIAQFDVTTTEVAVPAQMDQQSISVKASIDNTEPIYLVRSGDPYTDGYELSPGDSLDLDATAAINLFLIAATGTQRASTLGLA